MPSMLILTILGISLALIIYYIYRTYNELIFLRMRTRTYQADIAAALQKRFDMIPALAETVDRYVDHESGVFSQVSRLRSQWSLVKQAPQMLESAGPIESSLSKLIALEEKYPALLADKNFKDMQENIKATEIEVLARREDYNLAVGAYNTEIKTFPVNIVALLFGFEEARFFHYNEIERVEE